MRPDEVGKYLQNNLSAETKEVQLVNNQINELFRKSYTEPAYWTLEDSNNVITAVQRINRLCRK